MLQGFFQNILIKIREWINKMINTTTIRQAVGADVQLSAPMLEALQLWSQMYQNQAPWLNKDIKSLNLPATIASIIARDVCIEMGVEITGSARAVYLKEQFDFVLSSLSEFVEYGCAKGGIIFKPFPSGDSIPVDKVQADMFYPISFDANKNMTAVVFSDQRKIGQYYYTRLEYHRMVQTKGGMACQITNQVFRGMTQNELGQPASFDSVDAWADIEPEAIITGIEKPLFGYFRYPVANNIDTTSPLGISCFARAQDATNLRLIRDADEIYSQLVWEFESGKRAIYVEPEAFEKGDDNKPKLPDRRLYRTLSSTADIGEKGKLFTAWSPDFREASIKSGLDAILKKIEFNCGLAYGIISDPQSVALTATEIKASKQAYYATITNTQKALKVTLDNLIYAMDVWATLAGAAPVGSYTVTYQWDDSIVADHDTQFAQDQQTMTANKMPGYIFLMRNYGLDEATAKKWVAEADAEKQPFSFFPADQNQDMAQ